MALTKIIGEGVGSVDTITADNLTVDTNTLYVDSTNNRVGVGTVSPSFGFEYANSAPILQIKDSNNTGNAANPYVRMVDSAGTFMGAVGLASAATGDFYVWNASANPISFLTNGTERARIDGSGKVGIGTSSPTGKLEINGSDNALFAMRTTGDTASQVMGTQYLNNSGAVTAQTFATGDSSSSSVFRIKAIGAIDLIGGDIGVTGASADLRISSDGNVGIGTSPSHKLEVHSANATNIVAKSTNGNGGYLNYSGLSSGGTTTFSVTHNGNVYAADGINLGGTGSANRLDDYEEGTWTAGFQGATVSATNTTGYYTKIGRKVFFNCNVAGMNISNASGNAIINGLPFASSNANENYGVFTYVHGTAVSNSKGGFIAKGASYMIFITDNTTNGATYVNGAGAAIVAGFYFTDS